MNGESSILLGPPVEPAPVTMSYTGPGWIALYIIIFLMILVFVLLSIRQYHRNSYRRDAINALKVVPEDKINALIYIMAVLKTTAMKTYGRDTISYLTGSELFIWFNEKHIAFEKDLFVRVSNSVFSGINTLSADEEIRFLTQTRNWISKHGV